MKYRQEVSISKPIDQVIRLFDSTDNLYAWMEGLKLFEHLSGEPGQAGAKSKLTFQNGKREFSMIETITEKNLPELFAGTYEVNGVFNIIRNSFEAVDGNTTRYISESEFQFTGFMKLMAVFMKSVFMKQSMKHMLAFKRFAEGNH